MHRIAVKDAIDAETVLMTNGELAFGLPDK